MALEIVRTDSVERASATLAADEGARFLGGGTLLVRQHGAGDLSIRKLVLSDDLKLERIRVESGRAELGAAVTMAKVLAHPGLAVLHEVARDIGGPAVRAMATIGGNLFAPSPYGDFAVALLALGAEASVENSSGASSHALETLLAERATRRSGRIVTAIAFTLPAAGAFRFVKVTRRHPHGASVISIAALLPVVDGRLKGARVAYGAMAPTPIRAQAVERALEGKPLDDATIAAAVAVATDGTTPPTDPFASDWYRLNVLPVHLARLLKR